MEKVRPWCGQPSDRGCLKNRTELRCYLMGDRKGNWPPIALLPMEKESGGRTDKPWFICKWQLKGRAKQLVLTD